MVHQRTFNRLRSLGRRWESIIALRYFSRKARICADPFKLAGEPLKKARVASIRRIVLLLLAQKMGVQIQFYRMPGDAQILKPGSEKGELGDIAHQRVLRRKLP